VKESKRLNFLRNFLKLYEVIKVENIVETENSISGIAIYDELDPDERQEFIWHISEVDIPSPELNILIEKIVSKKWHNGDKISKHIEFMEFSEFSNETRDKILDELFDVNIKMVDEGEETDSYWVHF
jgi:hypothetical protein